MDWRPNPRLVRWLLSIVNIMYPRLRLLWLSALIGLLLTDATPASGQSHGHVRSEAPWLRGMLDEGTARSETLRQLVERLDASDVVAYIECAPILPEPPPGFGGRLQFVSNAGGVRYALVQLNCRLPRERQMALLGHELRHAVEVANAGGIVDAPSFGHYYADHGFMVADDRRHRTYETDEAQRAQAAVRRELLKVARPADSVPPANK
jgi:hypothetical protein